MELLLDLAKRQKLDLRAINIVALVDQYIAFIRQFEQNRLEIAADYLVMAAWLTYLKSRLLLPEPPSEEEPSGFELAENLTFHLARLEAMQKAATRLADRFSHMQLTYGRGIRTINPAGEGMGDDIAVMGDDFAGGGGGGGGGEIVWRAELHELLAAYGQLRAEAQPQSLRIAPTRLLSIEAALVRLRGIIGQASDWQDFMAFLPPDLQQALHQAREHAREQARDIMGDMTGEGDERIGESGEALRLSASYAAHLVALLELGKEGQIEMKQNAPFAPIFIRHRLGNLGGMGGMGNLDNLGNPVAATENAP